MSTITDFQAAIGAAVSRVGPGVVGFGRGWGRGSGVVIAPGRVLTSAHNVRGDEVTVNFPGGRRERGRVAGTDPDLDIAALDVETGDVDPVEWQPATPEPAIGTPVVALANPGGRGLRATPGFVSAEGRTIRGPRGRSIEGVIEHTAPLPRGSGGGPLVDLEGRLLGLNAIRLEGGLLVAIPTGERLAERAARLWSADAVRPAVLGVAVAPPRVAQRLRRAVGLPEREGVLVRSVLADSAAAAAGIERGDLLVAAGGRELDSLDTLYAALDSLAAGATLDLRVVRGTEERDVPVAFAPRAEAER